MKIINKHKLVDNNIAFELKSWPTDSEKEIFEQWCIDNELGRYVTIKQFYTVDTFGDIFYPAIQAIGYCPNEVETLILLRWS